MWKLGLLLDAELWIPVYTDYILVHKLYSLSRVRGWCDSPSLVHSCLLAPSLKGADTRAFDECFDET